MKLIDPATPDKPVAVRGDAGAAVAYILPALFEYVDTLDDHSGLYIEGLRPVRLD